MRNIKKVSIIVLILSLLFFRPVTASAWQGDNHNVRHDDHRNAGRGNHFSFGLDLTVPVRGSYYGPDYVYATSPVYQPVVINGVTYYVNNGNYYVYTGYSYQLVSPPVLQTYSGPMVVTQAVQVVPEPQNQTKVAEGMGLGGILGALAGGIIGHQMKGHNELGGALLGGVAGAAAGGIVGAQIPNENAATPVAVVQPSPVIPPSIPAVAPASSVVQAPAASQPLMAAAPSSADEPFTINIPNGQGGYTAVIIKRSGSGFVGPQGEYYSEFPKVSQLRTMYSK